MAVGQVDEPAQQTVDATGLWITPGFVDTHTHYDGQVTWDECFTPSIYHGVTTLLMGNCGVGFAPKRPGHDGDLNEYRFRYTPLVTGPNALVVAMGLDGFDDATAKAILRKSISSLAFDANFEKAKP